MSHIGRRTLVIFPSIRRALKIASLSKGTRRMPLEQELNQLLKEAMLKKDQQTADVLRMIKTKIMERRTAPGFKGQVDDPLIQDVIATYQKSLRKALEEYAATGDRGA